MGKTINRKNITLLLTACINPNGMSYTVLQDPNERKIQYEEALNYYLTKTKCKIVFVENTGEVEGTTTVKDAKLGKLIEDGILEVSENDKTLANELIEGKEVTVKAGEKLAMQCRCCTAEMQSARHF